MGKLMVRILDVSWASRCWPMLEILPELMGQLMSVQTCFSRAVFRAILSRCLHTPRHLQGVWDPFPQTESPEQSLPDVCTLPDTSKECGTPSPGQNLRSNLIWISAHSQTPPESVGPLPPDRISGAILSGCLHVMRSGHVFPLSLYSTSFPLHATPLTHIAYGLLTDL